MRIGVFQRPTWLPLLFLAVGSLMLARCDSSGLAPDQILKNGVSVSGTDNANIAAVATHRAGEWLVARSPDSSNSVREAVYSTANGDRAVVRLDDDGRPLLAIAGTYVLAFGKYDGARANVGLLNTESGTIETFDQVDLGINFESVGQLRSDSTALSPTWASETAGRGVFALVCLVTTIPAPDFPFPEKTCQTSPLLQVVVNATGRTDWEESAKLIGWGSETDECGGDYGTSCLETLTSASGTVVEEARARVTENEPDVARASAVVRFGGTWAYQDLEQSYFAVEEDLSYDISYSNFGECYFINRLEFLGLSGNVFRYKIRGTENVVRLQMDRVNTDLLTVTRLSDGREFEWRFAPTQNLQPFLDDECGSSSAAPTSKYPGLGVNGVSLINTDRSSSRQ